MAARRGSTSFRLYRGNSGRILPPKPPQAAVEGCQRRHLHDTSFSNIRGFLATFSHGRCVRHIRQDICIAGVNKQTTCKPCTFPARCNWWCLLGVWNLVWVSPMRWLLPATSASQLKNSLQIISKQTPIFHQRPMINHFTPNWRKKLLHHHARNWRIVRRFGSRSVSVPTTTASRSDQWKKTISAASTVSVLF